LKNKVLPEPLSKGHIQLWKNKLIDWKEYLTTAAGWLSDDENKRLERLKFVESQENFIISRGVLRCILALTLEQEPSDVEIGITPKGKPYLPDSDIYFNLSHSEGLMIVGLSRQSEIGIDLQKVYPIPNHQTIIKNFFSVKEGIYLKSLPQDTFLEQFFIIWTAKEAYLKGIGEGFQYPSNSFSILPETHQSSFLTLESNYHNSNKSKWIIHSLEPETGYRAATAIADVVEQISPFTFSPLDFFD